MALVGNPNSGKTTLFNALTGLRQKVGNYPGVTVEKKVGRMRLAEGELTVLDLPGAYSLHPRSPDEEITRDVLLDRLPDTPRPEAIVCVVDASNLERNLYLASQIMDLGLPLVIALNMTDVATHMGLEIDVAALEQELGLPVVPLVASRRQGLPELRQALERLDDLPAPARQWRMSDRMESAAQQMVASLQRNGHPDGGIALLEGLRLLGDEAGAIDDGEFPEEAQQLAEELRQDLTAAGEDPASAPAEARYDWLQQLCERTTRQGPTPITWTDRFDRVATHWFFGFALFIALMTAIFVSLFIIAVPPMNWLADGVNSLGELLRNTMPAGDLRSLLVDGVIAGVGAIVVFVPQIAILFLFIGLLEDSGYMARAAFIMDRLMSKVGLHGKSFIPLLSSFACAIPGIMATRTIENPRDRLVTILVAPLMSCSARIPVYTLLAMGFMPKVFVLGWLPLPALVIVGLYILGIVAAMAMAAIFKRTLLKGRAPIFLMELPPYKWPSLRTVLIQVADRTGQFLRRAGTVILAISIVLWFLLAYPRQPGATAAQQIEQSFAGRAGHLLEPVIEPLGFDWKIGIGLIGAFAAREVFVSTMATVYNVGSDDAEKQNLDLEAQLRAEIDPATGKPKYDWLLATSILVFFVLAMQCIATMAVVRRETNSWKWPLFQYSYMTGLAWMSSFIVYQGGRWLGF